MASSTFGSYAPAAAKLTLPQVVAQAMSADAQAAAVAKLDGHIGERVTYHDVLSKSPKGGVLLVLGSRSAMVRWDDDMTSVVPFISRLELEQ